MELDWLWSSIGPFPAEDAAGVYATVFDPEKDIKHGPLDLKKSYDMVVLPPPVPKGPPGKAGDAPEKAPPPMIEGADGKKVAAPLKKKDKKEAKAKTGPARPKAPRQKITWTEQRWRDEWRTLEFVLGPPLFSLFRRALLSPPGIPARSASEGPSSLAGAFGDCAYKRSAK